MKYAVQTKFRVTKNGKVTLHFIRPEWAPNTLEHATLFDTYDEAYEAADIARVNSIGYVREWSVKFIEVK